MKISKCILSIFLLTTSAFAAPITVPDKCTKKDYHDSVTYLLVDRSDKFENVEGFKKTLGAVKELTTPGERMIVGVSTGKASNTRILMDLVRPKKSIWVSTLKLRAGEKLFNDCLKQVEDSLLSYDESHKRSALLETLSFVSKVVLSDESKQKKVILYSDMMQNSSALSFYTFEEFEPEVVMAAVEKKELVWNFAGVDFYISGTGQNLSDEEARKVEKFWEKYFVKSGGNLKFYGPILLGG